MKSKQNVVLVVLDALRLDFQNILLDALEGLDFIAYDKAIAPSNWTVPSHASMLTGLYPSFHGAHETEEKKTPEPSLVSDDHLLSDLNDRGYTTYWFTANSFLSPEFGFQGMDEFYRYEQLIGRRLFELSSSERDYYSEKVKPLLNEKHRVPIRMIRDFRFKLLLKIGINWIYRRLQKVRVKNWPIDKGSKELIGEIQRRNLDKPFFIFMNLVEAHEPYKNFKNSGSKLLENDLEASQRKALNKDYEEEVSYVSEVLRDFLENILDDDPLVIITSDHGQLLGERKQLYHSFGLDDELVRVPLLIRYPKGISCEGGSRGWIPLTRLRSFILSVVDNKPKCSKLYARVAFSECFGTHIKSFCADPSEIENIERHKIAIFADNTKAIYDVAEETIDSVSQLDQNGNKPLSKRELLERLSGFLEILT